MRTVGVEEELLLVDPATRTVTPKAPEMLNDHRARSQHNRAPQTASDELDQELFRHMVETRTDPSADLADIGRQLAAARATAGRAARDAGLAVVACATIPIEGVEIEVSPNDRYLDMVQTYGEVARWGSTCGMHVHVEVESDEEGVGCIDRMAPWLPVLLAVSANSPYSMGRDTGYASWRCQLWSRWPSAGPTEAFGSVEGYRRSSDFLMKAGAARDPGMLYFNARLAVEHPTVEVRVLDVCTDPADAVMLAALVRALVETTAAQWADGEPPPDWRSEELRAATWRASRFGVSAELLDPVGRNLRPVRDVLEALVAHVRPRLEVVGDLAVVEEGVERVLAGNGATRQRAAFERSGGLEGVIDDLVARTEDSWAGLSQQDQGG